MGWWRVLGVGRVALVGDFAWGGRDDNFFFRFSLQFFYF